MDGSTTSPVDLAVALASPLKPFIAIPEEKAKEWVSVAYVRAIAAQIGLNVGSVDWDDGIDMEIGSTKAVVPGFDGWSRPSALVYAVFLRGMGEFCS